MTWAIDELRSLDARASHGASTPMIVYEHLRYSMCRIVRDHVEFNLFQFVLSGLYHGNLTLLSGVYHHWGYSSDEEYGAHPTLDKFLKVVG